MSLTASLWTGVSGLLAHGERMSVLGNNISNVNTVGFKASRMHFADFISQDFATSGNQFAQVGRGVQIAAVYGDFSQGSFETTNEATDLAIGGNGFFGVSPSNSEERFYTRAGNFRFDKDGFLKDTNGYVLQGWRLESRPTQPTEILTNEEDDPFVVDVNRVGTIGDIKLDAGGIAQPEHTNNVSLITQLDQVNGGDNARSQTGNPAFALLETWDGTEDEPLNPLQYAYQTTIRVFDESGTSHNLSVYYDQISNGEDRNTWEYIVTMDPDDDKRYFGVPRTAANSIEGTSAAGLLMAGTLSFNSAGQIENMSAYTLKDGLTGDFKNLDNWAPTNVSNTGYPIFAANFTGLSNASTVLDASGNRIVPATSNSSGKLIELNFGFQAVPNGLWVDVDGNPVPNTRTAADIGDGPNFLDNFVGFDTITAERQAASTTSFSGSSATLFESQDGFTFGFLQNILVSREGVLQGRYSNGVTLELFQVALFDFNNRVGLRREGGNLFSETRAAPLTTSQPPDTAGLGTISANSLELSNVDLAKEFVNMIATQRGFSANGKVITTADQMLSEVIMLKR